MTAILYYVSGHGYGHAVRSAEIMRQLLARAPGSRVLVRTDAPAWLFPAEAGYGELAVDVGLAQRDSLVHDLDQTARRLEGYLAALPALAEREAALGRREGVGAVVGDIPPLAFEVAARLGVPGIAVGNFSWDEIYGGLSDRPAVFEAFIERVRAAYQEANLLLRLPCHLPMRAFRRVEDVPLVARRASRPRAAIRDELGIDRGTTAVLLSFGGYDLDDLDLGALALLPEYSFLATPRKPPPSVPTNALLLGRAQSNYADLVAASDVVVTKLGYGIVADCLAQRVPIVYTDRPDFPEYPVLAEAVERLGRAVHVSRDDLRAGRLGPALEAALALDRPWAPLRLDGAEVAAGRILEHLDPGAPGDTVARGSGLQSSVWGPGFRAET